MDKSKFSNRELIALDQELIASVRNGSEKDRYNALGIIYTKHKAKCIGFVLSKFGERSGFEDIYHNAFIVFCEKLNNPRFELICQIQTFLNRVCYNQCLTAYGKPKTALVPEDDIGDITEEYFYPMEEPLNSERISIMVSILNDSPKTTDICREIIRRFWLQEQSLEQIAKAMEYKNTDVVKNRKSYCLATLKKEVFEKLKQKDA